MKNIIEYFTSLGLKYRILCKNRSFVVSIVESSLLFGVAIIINHFAAAYATNVASNVVTDVILDSVRVRDVTVFYFYVPIVASVFIGFLCLVEPRRIPFLFKTVALFILIRSVFISLTHLGIPSIIQAFPDRLTAEFNFGGDLFFSGHTGMPFLMMLVFWHHRYLRIFFFILSLVLGTAMLVGHLHYSIDVLSAFFITYAIFHIAKKIFESDFFFFIGKNPA
jgi:hypothetical protein